MNLEIVTGLYAIVRLEPNVEVPGWATGGTFTSVTRTGDELSLLCEQKKVPAGIKAERNFRCLKVKGPLAFSETGVLASLAEPIANAEVSLFALSTYETDYLFVKNEQIEAAIKALQNAGHEVTEVE